jgi:hypothetical protein
MGFVTEHYDVTVVGNRPGGRASRDRQDSKVKLK